MGKETQSFLELAEKRLSGCEVLSLDIFDTALLRKTAFPTDVFRWVEQDRAWQAAGLNGEGYHDLRIRAEKEARDRVWHERQAVEVTLEEIYQELGRLRPDWQAALAQIMERELHWERELTVPCPEITRLYQWWRQSGGKVVFTTDIYHDAAFIEELLSKHGYAKWDHLFVSSKVGVSKAAGRLFDHVLETVASPPSKILHIGDNHGSDVKKARSRGIKALHFAKRIDLCARDGFFPGITPGSNTNRGLSLYRGLVANYSPATEDPNEAFQMRLGYRILGPVLTAFSTWLYDQTRTQGIERLCFLARDGKIMRRAFALLLERTGVVGPEHHYLYASRRTLNMAVIQQLEDRDIDFLCMGNTRLPVRAFLERIGLDADDAVEQIRKAGFSGPEQIVQPDQYGPLREVFWSLRPQIESIAAQERQAFLEYLDSIHATAGGILGVVDIGWHGSMQTSLRKLLDSKGSPAQLSGFYLGLHPGAVRNQLPGSSLHGFFTHNGEPWDHYITLRHCIEVVEYCFSSTDPSCIRVQARGNGEFEPIFDKYRMPEEDAQMLEVLQNAAIQFLEDYASACDSRVIPLPLEQPAMDLARLLRSPTKRESVELGRIRFSDGFGNYQKFRLLGIKGPWLRNLLNPSRFKADFKASFWRAGYYAQLSSLERKWLKVIAPIGVDNISPRD